MGFLNFMCTSHFFKVSPAKWHGAYALIAVVGLFCLMPAILRVTDPSSGTVNGAYVQCLIFSTAVYFAAIFCGWLALQFDWKILGTYIEDRDLHSDWNSITAFQRIVIFCATIMFLISLYVVCYFALPKP